MRRCQRECLIAQPFVPKKIRLEQRPTHAVRAAVGKIERRFGLETKKQNGKKREDVSRTGIAPLLSG